LAVVVFKMVWWWWWDLRVHVFRGMVVGIDWSTESKKKTLQSYGDVLEAMMVSLAIVPVLT
jgi:hypothetical protein